MTFPRRADIYLVNLDPAVGTEIAKSRPALILSNDIGNQYSSGVIVAPITTQRTDRVYPFEVRIPAGESGLQQTSKVLLDQIRTLDKLRLLRRLGRVSAQRMNEVNQAIRLSLGL